MLAKAFIKIGIIIRTIGIIICKIGIIISKMGIIICIILGEISILVGKIGVIVGHIGHTSYAEGKIGIVFLVWQKGHIGHTSYHLVFARRATFLVWPPWIRKSPSWPIAWGSASLLQNPPTPARRVLPADGAAPSTRGALPPGGSGALAAESAERRYVISLCLLII